jgi:hypothetical protein
MSWTLSVNLDDYLAAAGGFLRSRPVTHTIQLTVLESLRGRGVAASGGQPPIFGWWRSADGEVTAAVLQTPPYPILLTALPEHSAAPLAEGLVACGRRLPGVNAAERDATAFAAAWTRLTAAGSREARRSRLFRLGQLEPPVPGPPGTARVATTADRGLLEAWLSAFIREIADPDEARSIRAMVADRLGYGGLTLWEVDGTAVAMAGAHEPTAGVVRVGPRSTRARPTWSCSPIWPIRPATPSTSASGTVRSKSAWCSDSIPRAAPRVITRDYPVENPALYRRI